MSTLLLIDGHSQAYRAYFGMKTPLSTRDGELTAAVFGFTRKLFSVLKEYKPEYVAVAFDLGDTWRHAEFEEYKATRERMPDDMRSQIERIQEVLSALNIPIITMPDYEADDVLGTLAKRAAEQDVDVLILTGDRDMFQLVDNRVQILYTSGGPRPKTSVYGLAEIQKRYEMTPDQFLQLKALTGDSSDNIPGVPGVGDKTAIKFLKQYGTLDNLYAHADEIKGPKTQQNLIEAEPAVRRNQRLMTIVTDLDLAFDPDACRVRDYDSEKVAAIFSELEFHSLLKELPDAAGESIQDTSGQMSLFGGNNTDVTEFAPSPNDYLMVQDEETLAQVVAALQAAERLSFDVETDSTDAMRATLVGLGIAWAHGGAAYIPVAHGEGDQLPWETVLTALQPFFADADLPKLAHNAKYDLTVCLRHGLDVAGQIDDTMTMAWLLDPSSRSLGLKAQALAELGVQMTELTELIGSGRKQITMDKVDIERAGAYCGADVDYTLQIYDKLLPRLVESGMFPLYDEVERPLVQVLTDMEMTGITVDVDFLAEMSQRLGSRLVELTDSLFEIVGHSFNLRSTQQLSQVLFEEMEFPTKGLKKTSSGNYSTAVGVLEKLAAKSDQLSEDQQKVLTIIFEQRQLEKLRGTYVDALPVLVNPETGRVHTSFNQTGAVTGRMSSSNPNLQNIPIRTDLGREVRKAFVPAEGWLLVSADYSQVELRVLAHVAQEAALMEAFRADLDIHVATASRLFDVAIEDVDRSQRSVAKTINFATVYGSSAFGISSRTDMGPKEAQQFLDQYFAMYPRIRGYIDETIVMANGQGYVETLLGRKRFFPELSNPRLPHNQRQAIERAAINAPIQGTAADIMKIAMDRLHTRLRTEGYRARMLLQVHDEVVLEAPPAECETLVALIKETMETAYQLNVPLKADVEIGPNWYDQEAA